MRVVVEQCSLMLRGIHIVDLVAELGCLAQYGKAVGKSTRHEELALVVVGEFYPDVLAEGGRRAAQVDNHVIHTTLSHPHQFGLRIFTLLEMETAQHTVTRPRLVILYEIDRSYILVEKFLFVTLHKIAPTVAEHLRLDDEGSL